MQIKCLLSGRQVSKNTTPFLLRLRLALQSIFLVSCLCSTVFVSAQCQEGQITIDGNPCDWNYLAGFTNKSYVRDAFGNGVLDSQFTQGSKDFLPALKNRWEVGQTKAKNDIANGAAVVVGDILYFAGDRTSNNGDAQIGFWFLLNGTRPIDSAGTKLFSPEHADGDLLVLADFTGGGRDADVIVLRWNGNGSGTYPNSDGNFDLVTVAAAVAINNNDPYPVPESWLFINPDYDINEFYEGFVDLGDLGPGTNKCFSSFMLETRSSQSLTASLDDFVSGGFNAKPAAPSVPSQARCGIGPVMLIAACTGSDIRWYTAVDAVTPISSDATYLVSGNTLTIINLTTTTTFYAACHNAELNCEGNRTAVVATVNPFPVVDAGTDKALTCTATSIVLNGSASTPGSVFTWVASNGGHIISAGNTATPTVNAAGTYTLTVTSPATGCTATDATSVLLDNIPPNVNAGPDKVLTCSNTTISLQALLQYGGPWINPVQQGPRPDLVIQWVASNGGNIVSGANTPFPLVNAAGTYTITVTDPANGCTSTDATFVLADNVPPGVDAGPDKFLTCTVTSVRLQAMVHSGGPLINPVQQGPRPDPTIQWVASNGGHIVSGANTRDPLVNAAGTYTITVTDPVNGCTATDATSVLLDNVPPAVDAGPNKVLTCTMSSVSLQAMVEFGGPVINPIQQGPRADLVIQWVASNGGNIVSGANTPFPIVNAPGTYTITVTEPANGCTATDVALVSLNQLPPFVNAGPDKVITCITTEIALSGSFAEVAGAPINPLQQGPLSFTFEWVASNGGHIVSGANTLTPIVDAAGTYTVTVTNPANGCTATDVARVVNSFFGVTAGPDRILTCSITTTVLLGELLAGGINPVQQRVALLYEFEWVATNGGNIVSGANTQFPIVNAAGTYTLTVTNTSTGCTATDVVLVTVNHTAPYVEAGANKVICAGASVLLIGSSSTAGATFAWIASNGGNIVAGANSATATVDAAGIYTLTVTNPANGCTATDVASVIVNSVDAGSIAGGQVICFSAPGSPLPLTNGISGTGSGNITYQWLSNTIGCNEAWTAIPGATAAGFGAFVLPFTQNTYYRRVTISTLSAVVCRDTSNCVAILSGPCGGPFPVSACTYTQGYFGNKNGNSCDGEITYENPVGLITALLLDPLTVGRVDRDRSVTIPASGEGAIKLNSILPGGKAAHILPAGNCTITDNNCISMYLTSQGRINNVLLSQTIVLGLNARMNGGILASMPIEKGWLTTKDQKGCGETATEVECTPGGGAIRSILMNENVADYLTDFGARSADVGDLIDLANDLLGGALVPGQRGADGNIVPSYSDVNAAIDAINNAFDGCRIGLGYYDCQKNCDNLTLSCEPIMAVKTSGKLTTTDNEQLRVGTNQFKTLVNQLQTMVYPNPYVDVLNLSVLSPVSGLASIEIYNASGARLSSTSHFLIANTATLISFKGLSPAPSLHYRVTIGAYRNSGIALKIK